MPADDFGNKLPSKGLRYTWTKDCSTEKTKSVKEIRNAADVRSS